MVITNILVTVTNGVNRYVRLAYNTANAKDAYWEVMFGNLLDGRVVGQLLNDDQRAYLLTKLQAGATDIDLVTMP